MTDVELVAMDLQGPDRDGLLHFLTHNTFSFHVVERPSREQIEDNLARGKYDDEDHQPFWVVLGGRRVGIAVLEELTDPAPLFDLRLADGERGRGYGVDVLRALTRHVFASYPHVRRLEGQTREDNVAMRTVFLRAGFVKEAHYREGWPVLGDEPKASIAYAMLRRDFETGTTTPLVWDDLVL